MTWPGALSSNLRPHLQFLQRPLGRLNEASNANTELLDLVPLGVIVLDTAKHVLWANRSAEEMFEENDGLRPTPNGLCASRSDQTIPLRKLIDGALAGSSGAIAIDRPSLRRPLSILIVSLSSPASADQPHPPAVVIFISDPEREVPRNERVLCRLFGFTPAEARLASLLMVGRSLQDCCVVLEVSSNTVRSQLKKVFEKTGTQRQGELIRLLLSSPAALRMS